MYITNICTYLFMHWSGWAACRIGRCERGNMRNNTTHPISMPANNLLCLFCCLPVADHIVTIATCCNMSTSKSIGIENIFFLWCCRQYRRHRCCCVTLFCDFAILFYFVDYRSIFYFFWSHTHTHIIIADWY